VPPTSTFTEDDATSLRESTKKAGEVMTASKAKMAAAKVRFMASPCLLDVVFLERQPCFVNAA
jgi:hypothetical protein